MTTTNTNVLPKQRLDGEVTLVEAKKDPKAGTKFYVEQTGSHGVILEERSNRGKLQARMTCTLGGPDHVREVSDWHQCGVSPEKKKKTASKSKKAAAKVDPNKVREDLEAELRKAQEEAGLPVELPVVPATPAVTTEVVAAEPVQG